MSNTPYPYGRLLWLTLSLFTSYLAVAMALPVISIFVDHRLNFGNLAGGLAVGIAFFVTVLTRGPAGRQADRRGGKTVMRLGLVLYTAASLICLAASLLPRLEAFGILVCGRLLIGLGESMTLVGMVTWGMAMAEPKNSGRFFAMMGAGMYGAFALGGPVGISIYDAGGFSAVMIACALAPVVGFAMIAAIPGCKPAASDRISVSYRTVIGRIWRHGTVVGLQGVGFAAIGAFAALLFKSRGWPHAGWGLAFFAFGFVAMRLIGPQLLDRLGSRRLTFLSLTIETVGQLTLWLAPDPHTAIAGTLLTGLGCSMIYPAMATEVITLVAPQQRGTAMGGYSAFQDVAYGVTGPLAGLAADHFGQQIVFFIGALATLLGLSLLLKMPLPHTPRRISQSSRG